MLVPGATYHVVARANRQEFILKADEVKYLMLEVLHSAKSRYTFEIKNFCIMGNHIHLLIKPGHTENLSNIMQWILSVFAIRYNRLHGFKGHVWYDRFKSKVIANFRQFKHAFEYIMANPVKAGITHSPDEYTFCGIDQILKANHTIVEPPDLSTSLGILLSLRSRLLLQAPG